MPLIRSFLAIPLPLEVQKRLGRLQQQLRRELPGLRLSAVENTHLTLLFLGDQPQQTLAEIGTRMLAIGRSWPAFSVTLKGLGSFPAGRRPRVIWLGIEPQPQLLTLQSALADALCEFGLPRETRAYRPHLTLGRLVRPALAPGLPEPFSDCDCGRLDVKRVVLFASRLAAQGAVHQALREIALRP